MAIFYTNLNSTLPGFASRRYFPCTLTHLFWYKSIPLTSNAFVCYITMSVKKDSLRCLHQAGFSTSLNSFERQVKIIKYSNIYSCSWKLDKLYQPPNLGLFPAVGNRARTKSINVLKTSIYIWYWVSYMWQMLKTYACLPSYKFTMNDLSYFKTRQLIRILCLFSIFSANY